MLIQKCDPSFIVAVRTTQRGRGTNNWTFYIRKVVNLHKKFNEDESNVKTLEEVNVGEITVKTVVERGKSTSVEKNYVRFGSKNEGPSEGFTDFPKI
jgi:hypothetical protein